ncbi:MAG: hypothetical protein ACOCU6_01510 [Nanoarchaeota archaeon]
MVEVDLNFEEEQYGKGHGTKEKQSEISPEERIEGLKVLQEAASKRNYTRKSRGVTEEDIQQCKHQISEINRIKPKGLFNIGVEYFNKIGAILRGEEYFNSISAREMQKQKKYLNSKLSELDDNLKSLETRIDKYEEINSEQTDLRVEKEDLLKETRNEKADLEYKISSAEKVIKENPSQKTVDVELYLNNLKVKYEEKQYEENNYEEQLRHIYEENRINIMETSSARILKNEFHYYKNMGEITLKNIDNYLRQEKYEKNEHLIKTEHEGFDDRFMSIRNTIYDNNRKRKDIYKNKIGKKTTIASERRKNLADKMRRDRDNDGTQTYS